MMQNFKSAGKISMLLTILFVALAMVTAYRLYTLPGALMLTSGYQAILGVTYSIIAITFLTGLLALYVAMKDQREVIVYKEKAQTKEGDTVSSNEAGQSSITKEGIVAALAGRHEDRVLRDNFLHAICKQLEAGQGAFYSVVESGGVRKVELTSGYALTVGEGTSVAFAFGEGLVGQAAAEGRTLYVDDIPEGYIKIISGLGSASPRYLLIVPVKHESSVLGVVEIASFTPFGEDRRKFAEEAAGLLAAKMRS
jgi:methyl-accepting chemotaxis protein